MDGEELQALMAQRLTVLVVVVGSLMLLDLLGLFG